MVQAAVRRVLAEPETHGREELMAPRRLGSLLDRRVAEEREPAEDSASFGPHLSLWDVRQLPVRQRAVILLVYWGETSIRDVSALLHVNPKAAQKILDRARQELRRVVDAEAPCVPRPPS